jgi:hypothetical protein
VLHGILYSVIVQVCSACGVTVVLADPHLWGSLVVNPDLHGRCDGSSICAGAASRVALTGVYV